MPDFFHLVSAYFWLIALGISAFNYTRAYRRMGESVSPDKLSEGRTYLRNFAVAGALPWVIMGAGQLTGATPTIWHYFRPQDGNSFVLAWLAATFALSCVFAYWVLVANGAKKVVEFRLMAAVGKSAETPASENTVKVFAALGLLVFPVWVFTAISMNVPLSQ